MDEKRKISLDRAEELKDSIGSFLAFKQKFLEETETKRNIKRKEHKQAILDYFEADENDWNDWKWQIRNRISSEETLGHFLHLSEEEKETIRNISHKKRSRMAEKICSPCHAASLFFHNTFYNASLNNTFFFPLPVIGSFPLLFTQFVLLCLQDINPGLIV